jgi:dihydropyrimidinase
VTDILVRGGHVVTHYGVFEADIAIEDGVIRSISRSIGVSGEEVIDASGKLVLPGGIDGHTHFQLNYNGTMTADDFYTGTVAAACGGITTVIDFVTPSTGSYIKDFLNRLDEASGKAVVDFGLHQIVNNILGDRLSELERLVREHGVASFKVFTAYRKRGLMLDDGSLLEFMGRCKDLGALVLAHCENEEMINRLVEDYLSRGLVSPIYHRLSRPDYVEAEAVRRMGLMAELTGASLLVVHLSSAMGLEAVKELKLRGVKIMAETCPHYLVLTDDVYRRSDGAKYIMSPPLKSKRDRRALWDGLADGSIDVVGSDHACFNAELKLSRNRFTEVPGGVQGVENIIPILYSMGVRTGLISLEKLVSLTSYNPARAYGLYPGKGCIMPGSDADVVILDPQRRVRLSRENLHSNLDHSIYEDIEVTGYVDHTISGGRHIVDDGVYVGGRGGGRYIPRKQSQAQMKTHKNTQRP